MFSFAECQDIISQSLKEETQKFLRLPAELYKPIEYILSIGGKRLRPSLTLMACNIFSDDIAKAIKPAIAIELFHNFTLLHDDIMDRSDFRRNQLTVHKKWNENIAILSGDALSILAYKMIAESENDLLSNILHLFTETALKVCEGQQFDMNYESKTDVSLAEYLKMIELKTSVLIAVSLKIGALCGNSNIEDADKLYLYGKNIGLAFQLQDDLLDVYGSSEFGKKIGNDIVTAKKTFLLINALQLASENVKNQLNETLNNSLITNEIKIEKITSIFDSLNIKERTLEAINSYFMKAEEYLQAVTIHQERKSVLQNCIKTLMFRKS